MNSIKTKIASHLKHSPIIYTIYYYIGSGALQLLKLFLKKNNKLILINSFGGKKFDDSPKAIYDAMLRDSRFNDYEIVWAFHNPELYELPRGKKVKVDTFSYFKKAIQARVWITNSGVERGLYFKNKHTFCLNTWHGTPIKKMGKDMPQADDTFNTKHSWTLDVILAQSEYEAKKMTAFDIDISKFKIIGLPRNDELTDINTKRIVDVKAKIGIPHDKKVILYAPTYREFCRTAAEEIIQDSPVDFNLWEEKLGDKYVVLFRAHYEVSKLMNVKPSKFLYDVSNYPDLNGLMMASDILISDYSSIFFDFAILERPMLCFAYDYDLYNQKRGLYFDIRNELGSSDINNETDLIDSILNLKSDENIESVKAFRDRYVSEYGSASKKALDIIATELQNSKS